MTIDELKKKYAESKIGDKIIEVAPRIHEYKNEGLRRELQKQADSLLPVDKQLAIYIHSKMCHRNHTDGCVWYYDIAELEHDWDSSTHREYLRKARQLLEIVDFETAKKVVDAIVK